MGLPPACVAQPVFSKGTPGRGGDRSDIVLGLVTNWWANPGEGVTALLAPPVVEVIGKRGVVERQVEDFGLEWPLPVADGV